MCLQVWTAYTKVNLRTALGYILSTSNLDESIVFFKNYSMKGSWKSGNVANKMYKYKCPILSFGIMFLGRFKTIALVVDNHLHIVSLF